MTHIELTGYTPGALGRITELHGAYYANEWGLGLYFEAKVATEMAEFLNRFDEAYDGAWFATVDGKVVGAIFVDGSQAQKEGARIRWFIIDPEYHGLGLGNRLMDALMTFCREKQFPRIYLTTFEGLTTARHLYEKHGFNLCGTADGSHLTGSSDLTEQVFEWLRDDD